MAFAEDLDLLEQSIRRLQIEWEKFFGGVERRPPSELKSQVEALIRKHISTESRNKAERFRYQTLQARYNVFAELWSKRLRATEEGRAPGVHGARAEVFPVAPPPGESDRAPAGVVRLQDPGSDTEAVRALFERFLQARKEAGETAAVKFESFRRLIAQQASRILAEKGGQAVDFRLETRHGKVSVKAKPVR